MLSQYRLLQRMFHSSVLSSTPNPTRLSIRRLHPCRAVPTAAAQHEGPRNRPETLSGCDKHGEIGSAAVVTTRHRELTQTGEVSPYNLDMASAATGNTMFWITCIQNSQQLKQQRLTEAVSHRFWSSFLYSLPMAIKGLWGSIPYGSETVNNVSLLLLPSIIICTPHFLDFILVSNTHVYYRHTHILQT